MYTKAITTFTFVLATALATASPLIPRQDGVTCQTSDASPKTADVTDVINQLTGQGGLCPQTNGKASDCTTLVSHNSAAISICGGTDPHDGGAECVVLAGYADQIQQACGNNGLVGGTYTISASQRVEVIHS
ncbi:hypothetical protein BDR22DRAFT_839699 [Usnea florida]